MRRGARPLIALLICLAMLLALPSMANAADSSAGSDPVTYVLVNADGQERVVPSKKLTEMLDSGEVTLGPVQQPGEVSPQATIRIEGSTWVTLKVYFNKSETDRLAAGAGACTALLSVLPIEPRVKAVLAGSCALISAWALSAKAFNSCVGVAITIKPKTLPPYPIYHKGYCY